MSVEYIAVFIVLNWQWSVPATFCVFLRRPEILAMTTCSESMFCGCTARYSGNILQISWEYPLKISKEFRALPLQVALEARSSLLRPSIAALVRAMKISSRRIHQSSSQIELPKAILLTCGTHKKFVKINGGPNLDSLLRSDLLLRHSTWCSATCAIHAVLTASEKRERSVNSGGGAWLVLSWCCMVLRGRKSNQLQVNPGAFNEIAASYQRFSCGVSLPETACKWVANARGREGCWTSKSHSLPCHAHSTWCVA